MRALELLTHDEAVPYMEYVRAISADPIATKVKLADLAHNSQTDRLPEITEKDRERLEKYRKAKEMLGMRLCTEHNLYFYNHLTQEIRSAIEEDRWDAWKRKALDDLREEEEKHEAMKQPKYYQKVANERIFRKEQGDSMRDPRDTRKEEQMKEEQAVRESSGHKE